MNKRFKGVLIFAVILSLLTASFSSAVSAKEISKSEEGQIRELANDLEEILADNGYESFDDIPKELLEPGYYAEDEIIYMPEEYFDPYHEDTLYTTYNPYDLDSEGKGFQAAAIAAAAGVYFIPGIGQIAITATGVLIIGGATIAAGSWLYNQVSGYFSKKAAEKAADSVPNSLKKSRMKVDLSKFKDKNGNTPADKTSGTFSNGKWTITKDNSGHLGYNGNKKAWKIGNPTRKASLDRYGNVISK